MQYSLLKFGIYYIGLLEFTPFYFIFFQLPPFNFLSILYNYLSRPVYFGNSFGNTEDR